MIRIAPVALALVAVLAVVGCSSDGDTSEPLTVTVNTAASPSAPSAEEVIELEGQPGAGETTGPGAQRNPGGTYGQYGIYERVTFPAESSGTTISDGVVAGTVNGYVLAASAGQVMTASITSVESNAEFEVYAPDDTQLFGEGGQTFLLPADGDHLIVVSSTRGNSSYELTIDISDSPGVSPDLG